MKYNIIYNGFSLCRQQEETAEHTNYDCQHLGSSGALVLFMGHEHHNHCPDFHMKKKNKYHLTRQSDVGFRWTKTS